MEFSVLYHDLALQHIDFDRYLRDVEFLSTHHDEFQKNNLSLDELRTIFDSAQVERTAFILKDVYAAFYSNKIPDLATLERACWGVASGDIIKVPFASIIPENPSDAAVDASVFYPEADTQSNPLALRLRNGMFYHDFSVNPSRTAQFITSYLNHNFADHSLVYSKISISQKDTLERFQSLYGSMEEVKKNALSYYSLFAKSKLSKFPHSLFSKMKSFADIDSVLPDTLYHGTQREFLDFSSNSANIQRNAQLGAGQAAYFSFQKDTAKKYSDAPMSTLLPSMVVGELRMKNPLCGDLLGDILIRGYTDGWSHWERGLSEDPREVFRSLLHKGINVNDIAGLHDYFPQNYYTPSLPTETTLDEVMFFLSETRHNGTPEFVYDTLKALGLLSGENTPNVRSVALSPHAHIKNVGEVSHADLDQLRSVAEREGYDGILYLHEHALDNEPEMAIWNTNCVIARDELPVYCQTIYEPDFISSLHTLPFSGFFISDNSFPVTHDTAEAESFLESTMHGVLLPDLKALDPDEFENDEDVRSPRVQDIIDSLLSEDAFFQPVVLAIPDNNNPYIGEGQHRVAAAQYLKSIGRLTSIPAYVACETPPFLVHKNVSFEKHEPPIIKEKYMSCQHLVNDVLGNVIWLEVQKGRTRLDSITYTSLPREAVAPDGYKINLSSIQDNPTIVSTFQDKNHPLLSVSGPETQQYVVHYVPRNPLVFRDAAGKITPEGLNCVVAFSEEGRNYSGVLLKRMSDPLFCDSLRKIGYDAVIDNNGTLGATHLLYPEKATYIPLSIDLEKLFDYYQSQSGISSGLASLRENFLTKEQSYLPFNDSPNTMVRRVPMYESYSDFVKKQKELLNEPFVYLVQQPSENELYGSHKILIHNFTNDNLAQEEYYERYIQPALSTPEQKSLMGTYSDFCAFAQHAVVLLRDYNGEITLECLDSEKEVLDKMTKDVFMGNVILLDPSQGKDVFNEPYVAFLTALKSSDCSIIQLIESTKNSLNSLKVFLSSLDITQRISNSSSSLKEMYPTLDTPYSPLLLHDIPVLDCYTLTGDGISREPIISSDQQSESPVAYLIGALPNHEAVFTLKNPLEYSKNFSDVLYNLSGDIIATPMHILEKYTTPSKVLEKDKEL